MPSASLQPIFALLGYPLAGNPTQYMVEKAFTYHQLDWRYLTIEVDPDDLADAVRGMRVMGFSGGNCADPHKEAILQHLDRLGTTAQLAGAVNCLVRDHEGLVGENTEGRAVVEAIGRRRDPTGKAAVVFGAGPMARAVAVELARAKVGQIVVVNRTEAPAAALVRLLEKELQTAASVAVPQTDYALPEETDLLVNATSIGQDDPEARLPLDFSTLGHNTLVADVIFEPPRTHLIRHAERRGCETIDGLEILVTQAAINFKLWTGMQPEAAVMYEAAEEFLEI